MKPPIAFVYGNCVFAQGLDDGWAAFVLETSSYAWLGEESKRARLLAMLGSPGGRGGRPPDHAGLGALAGRALPR